MLGPLGYLFASLDQYTVGVVHEDCRVIAQVFNRAKLHTCGLDCRGCGRHPTRSLVEKATGVSVGKGDWFYAGMTKLLENRLIVDDFKQCFVWKSLFVIADCCGSVDSGKDCSLTRRALRAAFYSQSSIRRYNDSVQKVNDNRTADQITRDDLTAVMNALVIVATTKTDELVEIFAKSVACGETRARIELKIFAGTPDDLEKLIQTKKTELGV